MSCAAQSSLRSKICSVVLLWFASVAAFAAPNIGGTWNRYPDPYPDPFSPEPPIPGGEPPLREPYAREYKELLRRQAEAVERGAPIADGSAKCLPEGMPTIMAGHYGLEILQTPGQVTVLAEFMTQTRRIYLDEALPPLEEVTPSYNGHSVARWNGDVLEVKTIGVREDVLYRDIPHTARMKVKERWRLLAKDLLSNEITIEDPEVLTRPYTFTFEYKRDPNYRIAEYVCDHNRNVSGKDGAVTMDVDAESAPPRKPNR